MNDWFESVDGRSADLETVGHDWRLVIDGKIAETFPGMTDEILEEICLKYALKLSDWVTEFLLDMAKLDRDEYLSASNSGRV